MSKQNSHPSCDQSSSLSLTEGSHVTPRGVGPVNSPRRIVSSTPFSSLGDIKPRDVMFPLLRSEGFSPVSGGFWNRVDNLKSVLVDLQGLEDKNDPDFPRYDRMNFENCYSPAVKGVLLTHKETGAKKVKKFSCGNKYCFHCRSRRRDKLVNDRMEIVKQLAEKGVPRLWRPVFTVPREIAHKFYDSEILKRIRQELVPQLKKRLFGVPKRANMAIDVCPHPVGDNDLMRDHPHFHVIVYPFYIDKHGNEKVVEKARLDANIAGALWNDVLKKVLGADIPLANNPQLQFLPLWCRPLKNGKWETSADRWARVHKRLSYDFRGFSKDFEDAPVDQVDGGVVLKSAEYSKGGPFLAWDVVSYEDYARRWMFVVDWNVIVPHGWLHNYNQWVERGYFARKESDSDDVKEYEQEDCVIYHVRRKEYCPIKKKVVSVREDWAKSDSGEWFKIGRDASWFHGEISSGVNLVEEAPF